MNVLIIEDEVYAVKRLQEMLSDIDPSIKVIASIGSVKMAVDWLKEYSADLIFLDIQLSDGISFSVFDEISIATPIIFTTAFNQYAIRAFELNSVAYLLKPIQREELKKSLDKLKSIQLGYNMNLSNLLKTIVHEKEPYKSRFLLKIGEQLRIVTTSEIAYFYAYQKAVYLRTFEGKRLPLEYTLDQLQTVLDPLVFFRINRGFLININSIETMYSWSRSRIKLELTPEPYPPSETVVSIQRTHAFKEWMGS